MWVKIKFFKGPQPCEVAFENVTSIRTVEDSGFLRLVISYKDEDITTDVKYSTPMYLINKLEVENDI